MNERPLGRGLRAAWPAMAWPLDPWKLSSPDSQRGSWRDSWLEATRWWTEALTEGSRTWPEANERLLADIAEGLARTFRGRSVDVHVRGRQIRGVLDRLW